MLRGALLSRSTPLCQRNTAVKMRVVSAQMCSFRPTPQQKRDFFSPSRSHHLILMQPNPSKTLNRGLFSKKIHCYSKKGTPSSNTSLLKSAGFFKKNRCPFSSKTRSLNRIFSKSVSLTYQSQLSNTLNRPKRNLSLIAAAASLLVLPTAAFIFYAMNYVKCAPNQVLVVSGYGGKPAFIRSGQGMFVNPFVQSAQFVTLSMTPVNLKINLMGGLTRKKSRIDVLTSVTLMISPQDRLLQNSAVRLLRFTWEEVQTQCEGILYGMLRQVVAELTLEEIVRHRQNWKELVQKRVAEDLAKLGLEIMVWTITEIIDHSDRLSASASETIARVTSRARQDVEIEVRKAEVEIQKHQSEARITISKSEKETESSVNRSISRMKSEISELQAQNRVRISEIDSSIRDSENQAFARISQSQSQLRISEIEANQNASIRENQAKSQTQIVSDQAETKFQEVYAELVQAQSKAKAEFSARGKKFAVVVEAEGRAAERSILSRSEAEANLKKQVAEAKAEKLFNNVKKMELKLLIDACGGHQGMQRMKLLELLPGICERTSQAIRNVRINKIVIWKNSSGSAITNHVVDAIRNNLQNTFTK